MLLTCCQRRSQRRVRRPYRRVRRPYRRSRGGDPHRRTGTLHTLHALHTLHTHTLSLSHTHTHTNTHTHTHTDYICISSCRKGLPAFPPILVAHFFLHFSLNYLCPFSFFPFQGPMSQCLNVSLSEKQICPFSCFPFRAQW